MRCPICGRPPQAEITADRESLLPREIACQGCVADLQAAVAEMTQDFEAMVPEGETDPVQVWIGEHRTHTNEQAVSLARKAHQDREMAVWAAKAHLTIVDQAQKAKDDADAAVEAVKP